MNQLLAYPIIIPSSGGSGEFPMQIAWAAIIVFNIIGLFSLLYVLLINWHRNKDRQCYKEKLKTTLYDCPFISFMLDGVLVFDFIMILIRLIYWVSTLL